MNKKQAHEEQEKKAMMKKALIVIGVILLIPAFAFLGRLLSDAGSQEGESQGRLTITENERAKGPENAKVTLVEYADFQCPACAAYQPITNKLLEEFSDDLRVIFRHFPLTQIHANAKPAAIATEAANNQGKFWEMHDLLFEKQSEWDTEEDPRSTFEKYAEEIGLDVEKFKEDSAKQNIDDVIEEHRKTAYGLGISSTPTFFLNGVEIENPAGFEDFKKVVEEEIARAPEVTENVSEKMENEKPATDDGKMEMTAQMEDKMKQIEYDYKGTLDPVDGGNGSGEAMATFKDGEYNMMATIENIPDPAADEFYEGWIVRKSPFKFISTGELKKVDGKWVDTYSSSEDLTDFNRYVLTIEPDDGDPAPAAHVVEGDMTKVE